MTESFAFSEVVRKLANLVRLGKISDIDGTQVKVQIGRVTTGWLPIVSTAGDTNAWVPITKGEQVVVFAPYGEFAQSFVLRSIHYNKHKAPDDKNTVSLKTKSDIKIDSEKKLSASTKNGFDFSCNNANFKITGENIIISVGDTHINISANSITLVSGNSQISLTTSGIKISCGSSTISVSGGNIDLTSGSITTNPPICTCNGGI